jgi:glycolate oxidase FAD binding subunit
MEQALQEFKQRIAAAAAANTPLRIRGGGSKDWYGQLLSGEVLDTRGFSGITAYEPTELVVTARCGTSLAEVEAVLAEQNQMLAFEPPHFGTDATIGGMVASGLSGPRRPWSGAVRDFVLGVVLMDGKGEILRFGGQVMKNVAGYDVSRLLTGSLGTLGLILEVSLKVLPKPFAETTLRFALSEADALRRLNEWGGQPLPLSASAWQDGQLTVRLSGAAAAIKAARQKLGGDEVADAAAFWADLREQTHAFFADAAADGASLWRLSVPSVVPPLVVQGTQLIEWGGAQRWLRTGQDASVIRAVAAAAGGHATLFRGGDKSAGVFHPLAPAVARIHRNLKAEFDPSGVFNPGRMYKEF